MNKEYREGRWMCGYDVYASGYDVYPSRDPGGGGFGAGLSSGLGERVVEVRGWG